MLVAVTIRCREWNDDIVSVASQLLLDDMPLPTGAPGGVEAFRSSLTISFFFKFYLSVRLKLEQKWVSSATSFYIGNALVRDCQ